MPYTLRNKALALIAPNVTPKNLDFYRYSLVLNNIKITNFKELYKDYYQSDIEAADFRFLIRYVGKRDAKNANPSRLSVGTIYVV